jgi:hypothetical protein
MRRCGLEVSNPEIVRHCSSGFVWFGQRLERSAEPRKVRITVRCQSNEQICDSHASGGAWMVGERACHGDEGANVSFCQKLKLT